MMTEQSGNIIRFPGEAVADVEAAAAAWLVRVTSGSLTLGELAAFALWKSASPDHDRIYREMEAMWDRLEKGAAPRSLPRGMPMGVRRPNPLLRWTVRLSQVAAAIVVVALMSQYLSTWRYDYHTAPGEIRRVALADGSTLFMKGGAALDAHVYGNGARTIKLVRGEAFFEVKHDASRPFTVAVGSGVVRDVGTGFSVVRTGRSATVAVEHGAVAVAAGGLSDTLTAGEQVSFNLYAMERKKPVQTGMISAWRRGLYVAESKPLGEVLRDLDDYHPGHIIITSHALATRRVNAVIQLAHIDSLLDSLDQTSGISVRRWGPLTFVGDRSN